MRRGMIRTGIFSGDHFTPTLGLPCHSGSRIVRFQRLAAPFGSACNSQAALVLRSRAKRGVSKDAPEVANRALELDHPSRSDGYRIAPQDEPVGLAPVVAGITLGLTSDWRPAGRRPSGFGCRVQLNMRIRLKGALKSAPRPRSAITSVIVGPRASASQKDAG